MKPAMLLLVLCFIAFISLGLPDALLGVAWPSMAEEMQAPLDRLGLIMTGGTLGYILSSFSSGVIIRLMGIAWMLALSGLMTVIALILFTLAPVWWFYPAVALVAGLGGGGIDAGLNTFVEKHYSERVMQWLHASFGVGVTLGPLMMTLSLSLTGLWRPGYLAVAMMLLMMVFAFVHYRSLWHQAEHLQRAETSDPQATMRESIKLPAIWLGMLAFCLYTSIEIGVGMWAFTLLTESREVGLETAGFWVAIYWGAFTVGRICAGIWAHAIADMTMTLWGLLLAFVGLTLFSFELGGEGGVYALGLIGVGFAPAFPAMISSTAKRVPRAHVANALGMQVSAAGAGMFILPAVMVVLIGWYGLDIITTTFLMLAGALLLVFGVLLYVGRESSHSAD